MKNVLGAVTALTLCLVASPASADIVTVDFAGKYSLVYFGAQSGPISGTFVYDTAITTHDSNGIFSDSVTSFSLTSGILQSLYGMPTVTQSTFAGSSAFITYQKDWQSSGFDHMQFDFVVGSSPFAHFTIDLNYGLGTFPVDTMLPTVVPDYTAASSSNIVLNDNYGDLSVGRITSLTSSATGGPVPGVPEPASWALMICGLGLAGAALRARGNKGAVRFA